MFNEPVPEVLYHYCSLEAFMGIIQSKKVWLSPSIESNDRVEYIWAIENIETLWSRNQHLHIYPEILGRTIHELKRKTPYVFCMSKRGDLLSQWRGYTTNASGFTIGFTPDICSHRFETSLEAPMEPALCKITYGFDNPIQEITTAIETTIAELKAKDNVNVFDKIVTNLIDAIRKIVIPVKHEGFREEEEWRIIFNPEISPQHTVKYPKYEDTCLRSSERHRQSVAS